MTAKAAPRSSAAGTKSWPSREGPAMAKKMSPGSRLRLSIEAPVAGAAGARAKTPPVAA
jgi:hypothetical protein